MPAVIITFASICYLTGPALKHTPTPKTNIEDNMIPKQRDCDTMVRMAAGAPKALISANCLAPVRISPLAAPVKKDKNGKDGRMARMA